MSSSANNPKGFKNQNRAQKPTMARSQSHPRSSDSSSFLDRAFIIDGSPDRSALPDSSRILPDLLLPPATLPPRLLSQSVSEKLNQGFMDEPRHGTADNTTLFNTGFLGKRGVLVPKRHRQQTPWTVDEFAITTEQYEELCRPGFRLRGLTVRTSLYAPQLSIDIQDFEDHVLVSAVFDESPVASYVSIGDRFCLVDYVPMGNKALAIHMVKLGLLKHRKINIVIEKPDTICAQLITNNFLKALKEKSDALALEQLQKQTNHHVASHLAKFVRDNQSGVGQRDAQELPESEEP